MDLSFYKYQGTGNDFVMVDNRSLLVSKNDTNFIKKLCDRRFGIGADGLILLENAEDEKADFRMVYYNSDGRESSMCGNGGRCIVAFADFLGIIKDRTTFLAIDGLHEANIEGEQVSLKMVDVSSIKILEDAVFLDTGSPHHVIFTADLENLDIRKEGAAIRYSEQYNSAGGTNVNFVSLLGGETLKVRTYERGVENETLSCGTGVTAVALAAYVTGQLNSETARLQTMGGELEVTFERKEPGFDNIWLTGPAKQVFKGVITC